MDNPSLTVHQRRRIEAEMLARVFDALVPRIGEAEALEAIAQATRSAAREAGAAFAAEAPDGPSLEHFATFVDRWRAGGALEVADAELDAAGFRFRVTRCAYLEMYRSMGLPDALCNALSCVRDAAFAAGYSPRLVMERPSTLALDGRPCDFRFSWR